MAETSMPCDVPIWGFDPMNPGPGFNLDPGAVGDEEMWYRSQFGMNGFDMPQWQPIDMAQAGYDLASPASGKTPYQQLPSLPTDAFHTRSDKVLPRFEKLQADTSTPYSLDDLLRTASQLATERALYMNIPPENPHTPAYHHSSPAAEPGMSSPAASPGHHSNASDSDEHEIPAFEFAQVYQLPEASGNANNNTSGYFPPIHPQSRDHVATAVPHNADKKGQHRAQTGRKNTLTPLEMPDGTTRFTANWLPVDPQGGFTIRPPAHHHPADLDLEMMMDYHTPLHQDQGHNNYNYRNAFISLDNQDAGTEAGV
ncbi:hypothetical protein BDV12DRAFT_180270 [Aspergillus spectabilis]